MNSFIMCNGQQASTEILCQEVNLLGKWHAMYQALHLVCSTEKECCDGGDKSTSTDCDPCCDTTVCC